MPLLTIFQLYHGSDMSICSTAFIKCIKYRITAALKVETDTIISMTASLAVILMIKYIVNTFKTDVIIFSCIKLHNISGITFIRYPQSHKKSTNFKISECT